MLQGYPFYGTGAAAPTSDNVTFYDPILKTAVETLTIRGKLRGVKVMGVTLVNDAPNLGSYAELRIGNSNPDYRKVSILPQLDGDLVTSQVHQIAYEDLGGIEVNEQETIDIRLYDPGAAENMSGVLWIEDGEPTLSIPSGRIVTLRMGGTNDVTTDLATTGFDLDSRKLENSYTYTPFKVTVRPENSLMQALFLSAGKNTMTLPPAGTMVYGKVALQFTGREWNASQVIGKAEAQAAGKFDAIVWLIESKGSETTGPNAPPINVKPTITPGILNIASFTGSVGDRRMEGGSNPFSLFRR